MEWWDRAGKEPGQEEVEKRAMTFPGGHCVIFRKRRMD